MDTVTLKINGKEITAKADQTILDTVHEQELDRIPTLCHSPELAPYGSCFVCVVELKGRPSLVPACATKVAQGMEVETRNERVVSARKTALELLISNHYADCLSPCKEGCPAHVDAQGYIALCAMGEYAKAVDLIRESNPFPAACGRVCVRKCEVVCRRQDVDSPVAINNVKRYVTDSPGAYDKDPEKGPALGKSIGIVGAGPAGLTAAWFLVRKGYDAVLYEMMEHAGGMLRYGIPEYRLPKVDLDKEIDYIVRAGAVIKTGVRVGEDITLDDLMKKHDAVFVSVGAWKSKAMGVEGEHETQGVRGGIEFLIEKAKDPGKIKGTIVVVGGGNTAMDCARTSWRLGADKVIILYRRTKAEMPADKMEIEDCIKEGIEIYELAAPVGIVKDGKKLKALKCIRMKLGEPDASGRRRPVPMEGSEFELPCDLALSAIGQEPILKGISDGNTHSPTASKWNTLPIDKNTLQTNIEGLYAGGDSADDGPTVVIDAIADGQRAARSIHAYLSGEANPDEPFVVRKEFWSKPGKAELGDVKESPRHEVHEISIEERANSFKEVSNGYEDEDAVHETARCLSCGCLRYPDCNLRLYADEYGIDMERYMGYIRKHKVDDRHPYIAYDPNKCILCARCIRTCDRILPISALGLVGRGFGTEMRPSMNNPLVETNCISCGNCVDSCPTGALLIKYPFPGRADLDYEEIETHCAGCSIGCAIRVRKLGPDRYYVTSSGAPGKYLCMYGRFMNELFIQQKRITNPIVRTGAKYQKVEWQEAYKKIVDSMKGIAKKHGPESVAVFVSPELTNEELYLASRIAREGLGTNNIGSLAILETGLEAAILDESFGFTASTNDHTVIKDADVIFCNNVPAVNNNLIIKVDIQEACRNGAKLIVSGSAGDPFEPLTSLFLDPMRGRASLMINSVIQVLLDTGYLNREMIRKIPGGEEYLADIYDYSPDVISEKTGVDKEKIIAAADIIKSGKKIVFVHAMDRTKDASPGDMHVLANFILLLRAAGVRADLLLPRIISNVAGMEITGADPLFRQGRVPSSDLPGAKSHVGLRKILEEGVLKAALIIGEDPMHDNRIASYFTQLEFLAVADWAQTETTLYADVTLPITTYLETSGTRCNYEGKVIEYKQAVAPRSTVEGWKVLADLASSFGIKKVGGSCSEITGQIEKAVRDQAGSTIPFYWNTGQDRIWDGKGKLVVADTTIKPRPIRPPLTEIERYKREKVDVGIEYFKVHSQGVL
jgi:formate dehydrogenase major subunit